MPAHEHAKRPGPESARVPRRTPEGLSPDEVLTLQRTMGNTAVTQMLSTPGTPLAAPLRAEMEARLGADFSGVRLHTGPAARDSAAEIGARAYTSGDHVVIGEGGADKHTLAHELTHVLQQRQGPVPGTDNGNGLKISDPSDPFEREAEATAVRALSGRPADAADPSQATRTRTGGEPAVQRAVGFEFEAGWKVRKMDPVVDEARLAREKKQRESVIEIEFLRYALRSGARPQGLTEKHNKMTPDELLGLVVEEDQLTMGDRLTKTGRDWYEELKPAPEKKNSTISDLKQKNRYPDEPILGENLPKHELIVKGDNFNLTADSTPGGGSNLEWVTKELDDEKKLDAVMDKIVAMVEWLNGQRNRAWIPSEEVKAGAREPVHHLGIYPDGKPLTFSPQLTAGMKLGDLPKLVRYLERPDEPSSWLMSVPSWLMPVFSLLMPRSVADQKQAVQEFTDRTQAIADLRGLGDLSLRMNYAETVVPDFLKEIPGGENITKEETMDLVSLVSHLATYLKKAESLVEEENSKYIANPLMSRTNFAHNFSLLPDNIKPIFEGEEGAKKFADLVLKVAGMSNGGNEKVYPKGIGQGPATKRIVTTINLTRRNWLENISREIDLLQRAEEGNREYDGQEALHGSLGALKSDKLSEEEKKMMVVEFREMTSERTVEQLKPLAMAAFRLIGQLTSGKKMHYQKQE